MRCGASFGKRHFQLHFLRCFDDAFDFSSIFDFHWLFHFFSSLWWCLLFSSRAFSLWCRLDFRCRTGLRFDFQNFLRCRLFSAVWAFDDADIIIFDWLSCRLFFIYFIDEDYFDWLFSLMTERNYFLLRCAVNDFRSFFFTIFSRGIDFRFSPLMASLFASCSFADWLRFHWLFSLSILFHLSRFSFSSIRLLITSADYGVASIDFADFSTYYADAVNDKDWLFHFICRLFTLSFRFFFSLSR